MEIIKIKKENEEKTVEVSLFGAAVVALLLGWALSGIVEVVNVNGRH